MCDAEKFVHMTTENNNNHKTLGRGGRKAIQHLVKKYRFYADEYKKAQKANRVDMNNI